jgi:hypothetical protein
MKHTYKAAVVGVILIALVLAYSQSPQPTSPSTQPAPQAEVAKPVKAKRLLVRKLPEGLEGMVLKNGMFALAPGFKFEPRGETAFALVRVNNSGGGGSATVDCSCSGHNVTGSCVPKTVSGGGTTVLSCGPPKENRCTGECVMVVTMGGSKTKLAIF